jgi:Xaa-Pro dipeptidase
VTTLPHADYAARRQALRAQLAASNLDALLVTDLVNVQYLTGFTGSNAALLIAHADSPGREDATVISTDGRYTAQIAQQAPDLRAEIARASAEHLLEHAVPETWVVGFESNVVTIDQFTVWQSLVPSPRLSPAPGLVEGLRQVKDAGEIELLARACDCADWALTALLRRGLRPGRTERQVARELENLMLDAGADGISFETIVATGANSALPHHRPDDTVLAAGDFVLFDFGALVGGYRSDMTRTVVLGSAAEWQLDLYNLVSLAQAAGRTALMPGTPCSSVDAAARSLIAEAGYAEEFNHGLGHGVGLQIHEAPGIGQSGTGTLSVGEAVTIEPGVYFVGRGGVRIEDTLVVRSDEPQLLTRFTKDLLIV